VITCCKVPLHAVPYRVTQLSTVVVGAAQSATFTLRKESIVPKQPERNYQFPKHHRRLVQ